MTYWGKAGAWIALQKLSCIEEKRLEVCNPASVTVCGFPMGAGNGRQSVISWGESAPMCWGQVSREGNSWKPWADTLTAAAEWAEGPWMDTSSVFCLWNSSKGQTKKDVVSLYISGHWILNKVTFSIMTRWAAKVTKDVKVERRPLIKQKSSVVVFPMTGVHFKFSRK